MRAYLGQDPTLAPLIALRADLRAPGAWDDFELAVRAVLGQQVTVTAEIGFSGKRVAAYGEPINDPAAVKLGLSRIFPTPFNRNRRLLL